MLKRILFLLLLLIGPTASHSARAQTPTLSIADATIAEGNSTFRELAFPVTLSRALTFDVSASFKTRDISTTAGNDYTPQTAGQIVIKAGQTRASIIIRVLGDKIEEKDESFLLQLGAPKRCAISDSDGIGSIKDDDYAGQITVSDARIAEGNSGQSVAKVLVSLSQQALHPIEIRFETKDDNAKSPGDYISTRGTLLFSPNRTATSPTLSVAVPVVGDREIEADERCFVQISAPGYLVSKALGTLLVLNDDGSLPLTGKIAFSSRGDRDQIYVINADGSNLTRVGDLTRSNSDPAFSPDGSQIAFSSSRNGSQIWVMNADGSDPRQLSDGRSDRAPSFSPDGKKLVFVSNRQTFNDIAVINLDGTGFQTLTSNTLEQGYNFDPSFSADGQTIVFESDRSDTRRIYTMNADGSDQKLLPGGSSNVYDRDFFANSRSPSFSRDGKQIVFTQQNDEDYSAEIWVTKADGSARTRLTFTVFDEETPCFSPDSSRIAWGASGGLFVFDANTTNKRRLFAENASSPSWAPGNVPAPPVASPTQSATSAGNS